ncbi:hypothetical protein DDZ18_05785 [Marinicauda salina]|uniref:Polymer-forming cytoskeletal protein n=1 Tax=Marinicauda salina TaxID=2135793 RepID=A0A2U2BT74_9PROT|nr:hypothetical protein [Marinicauda salina]PWE17203.1 hypothetical protein DDZ18_05785 [Marinicauda salina]
MTRLLLTTAAAGAMALALGGCIYVDTSGAAYASKGKQNLIGGDVSATLDEDGDFRVAGADVSLSGRVGGRLSVAGADFRGEDLSLGSLEGAAADVVFDGEVAEDVDMNVADMRWSGPVGGAFEVNAADLRFDGSVGGGFRANVADARLSGVFSDVRVNAADLVLEDGFQASGDVRVNAAELDVDGLISGRLDAAARTARIAGIVEGPLEIYADPGRRPHDREDGLVVISGRTAGGEICARRVVISGTVTGALAVTADEPATIEAGADAPEVSFTAREGRECERE